MTIVYLKSELQSITGKPCRSTTSNTILTMTKLKKYWYINFLKPNEPYRGRTAPLTSKRFILYIYSTNISIEYFKRSIYSPFFPLQNAVCLIILTYLVPVLFTFYIRSVLKLKKNNTGTKRLIIMCSSLVLP